MAFTGTAVIQYVSDNVARITGLSLAAGAAGDIGLSANSGADVALSPPGKWNRYKNAKGEEIELDASIKVDVISADAAGTAAEDIAVVKTGDGPSDFLVTLTNKDAAASGALEIYVTFLG